MKKQINKHLGNPPFLLASWSPIPQPHVLPSPLGEAQAVQELELSALWDLPCPSGVGSSISRRPFVVIPPPRLLAVPA